MKLTQKQRTELQSLADAYQQAAETYSQALADLVSDWESEFADRSERWQESDKGQEVQELIEELQSAADSAAEVEVIDFTGDFAR